MKEQYQKPEVDVVDLKVNDYITACSDASNTLDNTETCQVLVTGKTMTDEDSSCEVHIYCYHTSTNLHTS